MNVETARWPEREERLTTFVTFNQRAAVAFCRLIPGDGGPFGADATGEHP